MIYIIGTGPGDSKYVTLEAAGLIAASSVAYIPETDGEGRNVVEPLARKLGYAGDFKFYKVIMEDGFLLSAYKELALEFVRLSVEGKTVSYLTPGDHAFYSTSALLATCLDDISADYKIIAGIPSFTASSALAKIPLVINREKMLLGLMPKTLEELEKMAGSTETVVLMKLAKQIDILLDYLEKHRPTHAFIIQKVGMPGERVIDLLTEKLPGDAGNLSVAVIKK